ncbi:MAG: signal peptidase II [Clostridiales bacterium]|nr:signal peptidase II [Clostridiales bacterium]
MMKLTTKSDYRRVHITLAGCIVFLVCLLVDQITKALAVAYLYQDAYRTVPIIGSWIQLQYAENDAIAFGIGSGNQTFMMIVTALTVVMIAAIAVLYFTLFKKNTPVKMCLAVIEAGAIGNLIDRLFIVGSKGTHIVRDFVDVSKLGFGICNIADFCITFGAVALIFCILFIGKNAVWPLTKKWREESKKADLEAKEKENEKNS